MENTFLIGLSQQVAVQRSMDVIANNLANMASPAFKRERVQFEEYLVPVEASAEQGGGTMNLSFVLDRGVVRDLSDGRLETTGAPLDFALKGPGYFVVQTPEGERYTRNGHFSLDEAGRLVTDDGYPVQSEGGEIAITPEDGAIHVAQDGTISTQLNQLGRFRIVTFADERALEKAGSGLYIAENQQAQGAEKVSMHQGMIEKSNVEPVIEIARMIEVMRAYSSSADIAKTSQDMLKRAIERLGAVPQS